MKNLYPQTHTRRSALSSLAAFTVSCASEVANAQQFLPTRTDTFMKFFTLDTRTTALVLIDLQHGIIPFAKAPYLAHEVLANAALLAERVRTHGGLVVRVRVGFSADGVDILRSPTDTPAPVPAGGQPANWLDDPQELPGLPADLSILKRHWNAFHGTELDLQLRRRGIRTVILGGLVTPFGVESTARMGWELGYDMVFPEDLSSAPLAELHHHSMRHVLPRLGRVRPAAQVIAALG